MRQKWGTDFNNQPLTKYVMYCRDFVKYRNQRDRSRMEVKGSPGSFWECGVEFRDYYFRIRRVWPGARASQLSELLRCALKAQRFSQFWTRVASLGKDRDGNYEFRVTTRGNYDAIDAITCEVPSLTNNEEISFVRVIAKSTQIS